MSKDHHRASLKGQSRSSRDSDDTLRPHPAPFARAIVEDQVLITKHFRETEAAATLRQGKFKMLRAGLEREGIAPEDLDTHFRTLSEPGALEAAINWYRANHIAAAAIPPVSVPTLYIWGTADASVGRRAAELTEQFVSGPYRFVEIEGGGHFIVDQFPDYITQLLIEHVRSMSL
jgi:pimeloyl-ACP methyl ester carboxylesterase